MKTLSYVNAVTEEIEIGKDYYFGQLWNEDNAGDGNELLEDHTVAMPVQIGDADENGNIDVEWKVIAFEIKDFDEEDILKSILTVTDIY